jgi:hypothetical protein
MSWARLYFGAAAIQPMTCHPGTRSRRRQVQGSNGLTGDAHRPGSEVPYWSGWASVNHQRVAPPTPTVASAVA